MHGSDPDLILQHSPGVQHALVHIGANGA
eukprot:COSAG03_NODE_2319_length_2886_cov_2.911015_5_plen_28_part_01